MLRRLAMMICPVMVIWVLPLPLPLSLAAPCPSLASPSSGFEPQVSVCVSDQSASSGSPVESVRVWVRVVRVVGLRGGVIGGGVRSMGCIANKWMCRRVRRGGMGYGMSSWSRVVRFIVVWFLVPVIIMTK